MLLCLKNIYVISILDLVSRSVYFLFFFSFLKEDIIENLPKRYNMDYLLALDIILRFLFSRIILKTKIYKHHKVSIIICILGFAILIGIDLNFINYNIINYIYLLIASLRPILFSLEDTINQILLSKYFLLPHYLLVIRGIFEFIIFLLIAIILIIIKPILLETKILSFYNLILLLFFSIKAFCLMTIIYKFNSQYVSFLVLSETIGTSIVLFIKEKDRKILADILEIISLFLVAFGTLMYNEIIIINLFGLESKTKKNLTLEQNEEVNEQMMTLQLNENNVNMEE